MMQIRLSQRNLDLLVELWAEMTNKWINDFLFSKLTWNNDLQKILDKLDWLGLVVEELPVKKSCFSDDTTISVDTKVISLNLSEKQIKYWDDLIKQSLLNLTNEGFNWIYYNFDSLGHNISWNLETYVKNGVREALAKRDDIDFTLFKI